MAIYPISRPLTVRLDQCVIVLLHHSAEDEPGRHYALAVLEDPDQLGAGKDAERHHAAIAGLLANYRQTYEGESVKAFLTNMILGDWYPADMADVEPDDGPNWQRVMLDVTAAYEREPAEGQFRDAGPVSAGSLPIGAQFELEGYHWVKTAHFSTGNVCAHRLLNGKPMPGLRKWVKGGDLVRQVAV